jgi:hypothetical protein
MQSALHSITGVPGGGNSGPTVTQVGAAPLGAIPAASNATRLTLWGVLLFLLLLWGAVRVAGFRFAISTGVG